MLVNSATTMTCPTPPEGSGILPVSPFCAPYFHYGMLLGVDDLETMLAYSRGKMRLHTGWLHRAGVIWGYNVKLVEDRSELQVHPGLAVDAAGHELPLDQFACLDLGAWVKRHRDQETLRRALHPHSTATELTFDAHVVVRPKMCLTRQVPAIAEPCAGAETEVAFSRSLETIELDLSPIPYDAEVPADARPDPRDEPYHRLRLLFGLIEPTRDRRQKVVPDDQDVLDELERILANDPKDQPRAYLDAFRRLAALDVIGLAPPMSEDNLRRLLFPVPEHEGVILARVNVTLELGDNGWQCTNGDVDVTVRPSHVATSVIQDLLCGPLFTNEADAGGPRVIPESVHLHHLTVHFDTTGPLERASVRMNLRAFSVASFAPRPTHRAKGWSGADILATHLDDGPEGPDSHVHIELAERPAGDLVRLRVRGTGDEPVLGRDSLIPLAGGVGGPPGTRMNGCDFVHMWRV